MALPLANSCLGGIRPTLLLRMVHATTMNRRSLRSNIDRNNIPLWPLNKEARREAVCPAYL